MIVKTGRLYLWYNKISDKDVIIKVGTGSGSSEYVEIDQTSLVDENTDATIKVTTQWDYNEWLTTQSGALWKDTISDISEYIYDDDRKIVIYVMIDTNVAFELGEMGMFVVEPESTFDDWNGESLPIVEPASPSNGDQWFDPETDTLYTYTTSWDVGVSVPTTKPSNPGSGDMWFDIANSTLFTYTLNLLHPAHDVMISRNLMTKQFISTTETKIIKYTINI